MKVGPGRRSSGIAAVRKPPRKSKLANADGMAGKSKKKTKKKTTPKTQAKTNDMTEHHLSKMREIERDYTKQGFQTIVGVDEAGRGPLAGPVVAAACHVPLSLDKDPEAVKWLSHVADSKVMTEDDRDAVYEKLIKTKGVVWASHSIDAPTIDRINILQASMRAMHFSVEKVAKTIDVDCVVVDGNRLPWGHEEATRANGTVREADPPCPKTVRHHEAIVKGDGKVLAIAAASIIAKVTRDRLMKKLDKQYPQYNLAQHKGYPVSAHVSAIYKHGPCKIHRMTFKPLKDMDLSRFNKSSDGNSTDVDNGDDGPKTKTKAKPNLGVKRKRTSTEHATAKKTTAASKATKTKATKSKATASKATKAKVTKSKATKSKSDKAKQISTTTTTTAAAAAAAEKYREIHTQRERERTERERERTQREKTEKERKTAVSRVYRLRTKPIPNYKE